MDRDLNLTQIKKNVSYTLARQALTAVLGLIVTMILARVLGPEGNGQYSLAIVLPNLLVLTANLGLGTATTYFVSRGDFPLNEVIRKNIFMGCLLALLSVLVGFLFVTSVGDRFFPGVPKYLLLLGLLIVPVNILLGNLTAIFQGLQDFRCYNLLTSLPQAITLGTVAIWVWQLGGGAAAAILANVMGYMSGLGAVLYMLRPHLRSRSNEADRGFVRASLGYGWKAHLSNIITFLNYRFDTFLVNGFLGPASVGVYTIAVLITERMWILSQSVSTVLFPLISMLNNDDEKRIQITPLLARWILVSGILLSLIVGFSAKRIIIILFGITFVEAGEVLLWLLPGAVFWGFARILCSDIAARGKPEINLYLSVMSLITNIVANLILIPRFGIEGAAMASSISYSLLAGVASFFYSRLCRVRAIRFVMPSNEDCWLIRAWLKSVVRTIH